MDILGWFTVAENLDKFNAGVEFMCFFPALMSCWQILKVKNADCESLIATFWYVGAFVWWTYYFWQLAQFWSFLIILLWGLVFIWETWLILWYKMIKKTPTGAWLEARFNKQNLKNWWKSLFRKEKVNYLGFIDTLGIKNTLDPDTRT